MFIDCGTCAVRGAGCADCVVTMILDDESELSRPAGIDVGADERRAISALAQVGLVPELRHRTSIRRVS